MVFLPPFAIPLDERIFEQHKWPKNHTSENTDFLDDIEPKHSFLGLLRSRGGDGIIFYEKIHFREIIFA